MNQRMRPTCISALLLIALHHAQAELPEQIAIKLVTDLETATLASAQESFREITKTEFSETGSRTIVLGEDVTLWVRNAYVDDGNQKFFFEKYHQGKYIGRDSSLFIPRETLRVGKFQIQPGNHEFELSAEGKLSSNDPEIRIDGNSLMLQMHEVSVYGVEDSKSAPVDFRKVPANVGLFSLEAEFKLNLNDFPDPKYLRNPRTPIIPKADQQLPMLTNLISHQKDFYPLKIWLPSNSVGQGYLLYPSWQAFHVTKEGRVDLDAAGTPDAPGISVEGSRIIIPYRKFGGRVRSRSGLNAGVGAVTLQEEMSFSASLESKKMRAGVKVPPEDFYLNVSNDFSKSPYRFFLADNTTDDLDAVRMMAVEWGTPVFTRGQLASVSMRLLETKGKETIHDPVVKMSWSAYDSSLPTSRVWNPVKVVSWQNGLDQGLLQFEIPDQAFGFYIFRTQIFDKNDPSLTTPLESEIRSAIIEPAQTGTASFVADKGRNAFVVGEEFSLQLVLRSQQKRGTGKRTVVMEHPATGEPSSRHRQTLEFQDTGESWHTETIQFAAERTSLLAPGQYKLSVEGLPDGAISVPYTFDLVDRQKSSLYLVVKPSKYTGPMNGLETSHSGNPRVPPVDLDRAMNTLADLGYNRVDLMTYITNHHMRYFTWREELAATDPRLPAPFSVYTPTPRNQIINACVRNKLQFSDVLISYNDFHLPRYIEPYVKASERWMAREVQAMRHSPAFDGIMLYDEMYDGGVSGLVEHHKQYFAKYRAERTEKELGQSPGKIESDWNRYLQRPRNQRDAKFLEGFLAYRDWWQLGWKEWIDRMVRVGKQIAPHTRYGTYHRTWASPGSNDEVYNGWAPDLFSNLDIISHVHYADNITAWVSIPALARILRTGTGKTLYVNMPLAHEGRTRMDGQYTRHMAFALMAQGANGICQYGVAHSFDDGPNPETAKGRETTKSLNGRILQPFGEIIDKTVDSYKRVGIVSTKRQHFLSEFKNIPVGNQTEGIFIACWRLGFPATFLRDEHFKNKLEGFDVIFVPGIRYDGELEEDTLKGLRAAIASGTKVVVEQGSTLDLPGIVKLDDWPLTDYFIGNYFPTWNDDELNKVYALSEPIADYLRERFQEWKIEPAARGPFKVGPSWRQGGKIQYLVMGNFEDPDYGHTVRQQMAKPVVMPLAIAAHRGKVAYDLIGQRELEIENVATGGRPVEEISVKLDMTRVQGSMVAFTPERISGLKVKYSVAEGGSRLRLKADLVGESGESLGVFPTRIEVVRGLRDRSDSVADRQDYYRVLGNDLAAEFDIPHTPKPETVTVRIREALSGKTAEFQVESKAIGKPSLQLADSLQPFIPRPDEVSEFLKNTRKVVIVPGTGIDGLQPIAEDLLSKLKAKGVDARVARENEVYHIPLGDPDAEDPKGDGFHSWRKGQAIIGPGTVVDDPVILMGGRESSFLLDTIDEYGFLQSPPIGGPNQRTRPSIQVATKALHFSYDTLCLVANESEGMKRNVETILSSIPFPKITPPPSESSPSKLAESNQSTTAPGVLEKMGTNEMVVDLKFDTGGNLYVITWGHGKNLYSFAPDGKLRFSKFLPEMGTNHLSIHDDRILAYTSAGARYYALTLDGEPIHQARLNMDPGTTRYRENYGLSWANFAWSPALKLLLHSQEDRMRVLDENFNVVAEWEGEKYFDKDVSDFERIRTQHGFVLSPDKTRMAQIERSMYFTRVSYMDVEAYDQHLVIRDLSGKLLYENKNIENSSKPGARLTWPDDAVGPIVYSQGERIEFDAELKVISNRVHEADSTLGGDRRLVREGRSFIYFTGPTKQQSRLGPLQILPTYTAQSHDLQHIAMLDEYGLMSVFKCEDGSKVSEFKVPEIGEVLRFSNDSQTLLLGTFQGSILAYDVKGGLKWKAKLGDYNDILGSELALYDPAFKDHTEKLWPVSRDAAGQLETLVRMGNNRLTNGDCETETAWAGSEVAYGPGYNSNRALLVGSDLIGQEITQYLGNHVTWVLEFFYRNADAASKDTQLLAGVMSDSDYPDSVARTFEAGNEWRFGSVVVKNGANCKKLSAGFWSKKGKVLVDDITYRRIRFPSVNHLHYEPIYRIKPVVLENPLFSETYDPIGRHRNENPNRIIINPLQTGVLNLVEEAFLQNGRINEIGSKWYVQPNSIQTVVSCGMHDPRWISMVALYFNAYDEKNIMPHFDIVVTDMETKKERVVASIRHNGQLFRLVKFDPVKTPMVKVKLVNSIKRLRTLTEVELYGPLSGQTGTPGFVDPEGQNTWMGDFTRVDKREKKLAPRFDPVYRCGHGHGDSDILWNPAMTQLLVSEDKIFSGRALGKNTAFRLSNFAMDKGQMPRSFPALYWGRAGGMGFTPFGTIYGGLILRCGLDGKLYCINPETGTELWSSKVGERLFGSPIAIGEDLFVANDKGSLFQLDFANGSIMKQAEISGPVLGSMATDGRSLFLITDDGLLHSVNVSNLNEQWKTPVAAYTDSTPAVDAGIVYLADQKGTAMAVNASDGTVRWSTELGDEFTRCPVVGETQVLFGCRGGTLASLNRADGKVLWQKKVKSRFQHEPIIIGDEALYVEYKNDGKADAWFLMLAKLSSGESRHLQTTVKKGDNYEHTNIGFGDDPIMPLSYYKGSLFLVDRHGEGGHVGFRVNYAWHPIGGNFYVIRPTVEEEVKK